MIAHEETGPYWIAWVASLEIDTGTRLACGIRKELLESGLIERGGRVGAPVELCKVHERWQGEVGISADAIFGAMGHEVGYGLIVLGTATHRAARMNRYGADHVAHRTGHRVRHGAAHAEALTENARPVDAEFTLDGRDELT